jgi:uncharacterized delta-60 repeat protein
VTFARFQLNGQLDPTFGSGGNATISFDPNGNHSVNQIFIQPDNKIVVCGFVNINNEISRLIFRLLPNGNLDTDFATQGFFISPWERAGNLTFGTALGNGKLLFYGTNSELFDALYYGRVVSFRLFSNGKIDTTYNGYQYKKHRLTQAGASRESAFLFTRTQSGHSILYCTAQNPITSVVNQYIYKLDGDGNPDSTFGVNGIFSYGFSGVNTSVTAISVSPSGRILLSGVHRATNTSPQKTAIYGIKQNGGIDSTFGNDGIATYTYPNWPGTSPYTAVDLKFDNQGKIYVGHWGYTDLSTSAVFAVSRFNPNGQTDLSYGFSGSVSTNIPGAPRNIYLDPVDGLPVLTGQTNLSSIANGVDFLILKVKPSTVSVHPEIESGISIYPNPANLGQNIFFSEVVDDEIQIHDALGRVIPLSILNIRQNEKGIFIETQNLKTGIYLAIIRSRKFGTAMFNKIVVSGN